MEHLTLAQLENGLDAIRQSPQDEGRLELIVRRPDVEVRESLEEGVLNQEEGLAGDNWRLRGSSSTTDGSAHPGRQITLMNARVIALIAQQKERWQLAGDQLFVDLDLSVENVPPGTRLILGSAVLEVTDQPHTGCNKFATRFGLDALKFVSSPLGKQLHMRGIYARVVQPGLIRVGDVVKKQ